MTTATELAEALDAKAKQNNFHGAIQVDGPDCPDSGLRALHNWACSWGLNPPHSRRARMR